MKAGEFKLPEGKRFDITVKIGDTEVVLLVRQIARDDYHWTGSPPPILTKPILKSNGEPIFDDDGVVRSEPHVFVKDAKLDSDENVWFVYKTERKHS